tara:strand:- start:212 stop:616 length:405 start_codon:yes stop_codon:yes gene_type:complete
MGYPEDPVTQSSIKENEIIFTMLYIWIIFLLFWFVLPLCELFVGFVKWNTYFIDSELQLDFQTQITELDNKMKDLLFLQKKQYYELNEDILGLHKKEIKIIGDKIQTLEKKIDWDLLVAITEIIEQENKKNREF